MRGTKADGAEESQEMVSENTVREFAAKAIALGAKVERFANPGDAEKFLSDFFRKNEIKNVLIGKKLEQIFGGSGKFPILKFRDFGEAEKADAGIILADYGISETGTIVQFYQDDREKLPGILPGICLCLLEAEKIVKNAEAIADEISNQLSQGKQVAFLSGPSRTADIECELQIGVHGPAELVILLIDEAVR